jgi:hypothetical protein
MTGKMRGFGVMGLAVFVAALSGCVVDSGRNCGPSDITFSWSLSANGRTGLSCGDVGAETVVIIVGGASAEFPCRNYAAVTDPVVPATYTTSFQLLDASRNVIATLDPMDIQVASCGVNLGQVVFEACSPSVVSLNWKIVKAATNVQLSCGQAAATKVRLVMGAMSLDFACTDGAGVTPEVAPGTYQTTATLLGAGDQPLSDLPPMNITVPACGGVALPPIVFPTP